MRDIRSGDPVQRPAKGEEETAVKRMISLFLCLLLLAASAGAESLVLPDGLYELESEAFADCSCVREVTVPASVEIIGDRCFSGAGETLWVHCAPGSAAHTYALQYGLDYDADTQCRALVIGQNYTGTNDVLYGPANDARAMRMCLMSLSRMNYTVIPRTNLTAAQIVEAIGSAFATADETDISLLFYSGHGDTGGCLVGSDLVNLSPSALRAALDAVPGRKVVIVDACYSGSLAEVNAASTDSAAGGTMDDFNAAFLRAFSSPMRKSASASPNAYYVMTSARSDEVSWEHLISSGGASQIMGFFSYSFCMGCGWDGVAQKAVAPAADANADGAVSIAEAFAYARDRAMALANSYEVEQNAQSNAAGCTAFSPFR